MKKNGHFYFNDFNQRSAAEDGKSIVKKTLWVFVIVFALLVIQGRMNLDAEKFQAEQAAIMAASCN